MVAQASGREGTSLLDHNPATFRTGVDQCAAAMYRLTEVVVFVGTRDVTAFYGYLARVRSGFYVELGTGREFDSYRPRC